MNGQYHLINRKGNKFKFYWAPMHPEINRTDYSKWEWQSLIWIGKLMTHVRCI